MKITSLNLQRFIDHVEYDYSSGHLIFSTNVAGYYVPFSMVRISIEPNEAIYLPKQLDRMKKAHGVTTSQIIEGIELCKALRGYC